MVRLSRNTLWQVLSFKKFRIAITLILLITLIGVVGYMLIEKLPFLDALYMTAITISTVGFREVVNLSQAGKIFTIFVIILSLVIFAYSISVITTYLVEGELNILFKGYIRKTDLKKMKNHVIICGYGRNGKQAVIELMAHEEKFIVIDINRNVVLENDNHRVKIIEGDATDDDVLKLANIENAKSLITTFPEDSKNTFVVLSARFLNPDLNIISRSTDESSEKKIKRAGANHVVLPEKIGGAYMARLVADIDVLEFLEHLSIHGEDPTNIEEIVCDNLSDDLIKKSIFDLGIRKKFGANIIGFKTPDGNYSANPTPDTSLIPGSKLFVLGTIEQIKEMKNLLFCETKK